MNFQNKYDFSANHSALPRHIAIIMDGNGRWAKKRGLPRSAGHNEGVNSVNEIVEACGELSIPYLTIYTFSEENWNRPGWEVTTLMQLLVFTINKHIERLHKNNVQLRVLGRLSKLPAAARNAMQSAIEKTRHNNGLVLNVALSYGGRQEITEAVKILASKIKCGDINPEEITEQTIADNLDTAGQPDPDLIIRTGGESRLSNFLLWQVAYAEIYVTDTAWPDFRRQHFFAALHNYMHRERRFGKVSEQTEFTMTL